MCAVHCAAAAKKVPRELRCLASDRGYVDECSRLAELCAAACAARDAEMCPESCPLCLDPLMQPCPENERHVDSWGYTECCAGYMHFRCARKWAVRKHEKVKPYVHSSAGQGELVGGCPLCRREETMTRWSATRGVLKCGMRPGDWSRQ